MDRIKVLYFMPDSPLHKDAGNKMRALQLLEYFHSRQKNIELDFVSELYWGNWSEKDVENFKIKFPQTNLHILQRKISKRNKIRYFIKYKLPNAYKKNDWLIRSPIFPNNNTVQLQKGFNDILKSKVFDYIIISYATWASLIKKNLYLNKAILINDTHDFITAQNKNKRNFQLGKSMEKELELLSLFDEIWSVSNDEQYLFSQFLGGIYRFIPTMYPAQQLNNSPNSPKKYELLYVGSENEHNIRSINWFFSEVYPLLESDYKICVIGKICDHIPDFPNVVKIRFAENIEDHYKESKIAICPMLTGTGIKVKVVESMSYGLPIVCSPRGLDGLPIKDNNGCLCGNNKEEFAHHIQNLLGDKNYYEKVKQDSVNTFNNYFEKEKCYNKLDEIFKIKYLKASSH